jgi:hypothetical protein
LPYWPLASFVLLPLWPIFWIFQIHNWQDCHCPKITTTTHTCTLTYPSCEIGVAMKVRAIVTIAFTKPGRSLVVHLVNVNASFWSWSFVGLVLVFTGLVLHNLFH